MEATFFSFFLLPIGLGLLGFFEPCSMGTNLLFIKHIEHRTASAKISAALIFMSIRGLTIGLLGGLVAILGTVFIEAQQGIWLLLGGIYFILGLVYLAGKGRVLSLKLGPRLSQLTETQSIIGLSLLFAFNIPACAAPLLFVLFGTAAAGTVGQGTVTMALFGLALSLPLVLAVSSPILSRQMERLAGLSQRLPFWTGVVFILLGLWSIYFGLFVNLEDWT
ncbi:hypothetical protein A9Q83_13450 [Alphaproteobacteria bacterium 46_93_T64]|nr:hypothetical protein A9Q83_13450 [Alphaproteobacteria bacterium 46_93_T64]